VSHDEGVTPFTVVKVGVEVAVIVIVEGEVEVDTEMRLFALVKSHEVSVRPAKVEVVKESEPVELIVIAPDDVEMVIPVPAVRYAGVYVFEEFPIRSCPEEGIVETPVPPCWGTKTDKA